MRTSNPALREDAFNQQAGLNAQPMTIGGTVQKTAILLALAAGTACVTWQAGASGMTLGVVGLIAGLILCLVICFKPTLAPMLAPVYAICEGLFLGAISYRFQAMYDGIVLQAVLLTFGTAFGLLGAYQTGLIRATENFKLGIFAATAGIALTYLVSIVLGFFGMQIPMIHESGLVGIGFSVFVVIIAALNLVLDFDFIEQGSSVGAPKYLEWYAAFGLLVTLVWLYIEILRLLAKLRAR
jgi:uncharacterized YccA/Bax inhibitor family protein